MLHYSSPRVRAARIESASPFVLSSKLVSYRRPQSFRAMETVEKATVHIILTPAPSRSLLYLYHHVEVDIHVPS